MERREHPDVTPKLLELEAYSTQAQRWPSAGRHILAQSDPATVVVYQGYRPSIGLYSAEHGRLGGEGFGLGRMSWIKPNFLWMMYRSGWGTKEGQEVVLALWVARVGFERLLAEAVPSTHWPERHATREEWQRAVAGSDVRIQWDPDHDPMGTRCERRALQIGMRGAALRRFVEEYTVGIEDVSALVAEGREHRSEPELLRTPRETVYEVGDAEAHERIGLGLRPR